MLQEIVFLRYFFRNVSWKQQFYTIIDLFIAYSQL